MASEGEGSTANASAPQSRPVQVKLVLLGEAAVGKSSVVLRFVQNDFQENKEPTIGAAFLTQKCRLEDKVIKFEIWDTAGQERFHSLAPMYYRNAAAAVVVYDVTNAPSLDKAKSWVKELQRQSNPNIVIAFVGNKVDLVQRSSSVADESTSTISPNPVDDEADDATATPDTSAEGFSGKRQVPRDEAAAYAAENNLLFFETSAKTGEGVVEVFTEIATKIPIDHILSAGRGAGGTGTQGRSAGRTGAAAAGRVADGRVQLEGEAKKDGCAC